jgi:hypothetical protein
MPAKPRTAAGYSANQVEHVRATCLYVATRLGDLLNDVASQRSLLLVSDSHFWIGR